jgi:hypothetical protein
MKVANNEVNKFKRQYEAIDGNWPSYIYIPGTHLLSINITEVIIHFL